MTAESLDDLVVRLEFYRAQTANREYYEAADCFSEAKEAIVALRARAETAEDVADAQTKGVYSKYMLDAGKAVGRDVAQGLRIAGLEAEVVELKRALAGAINSLEYVNNLTVGSYHTPITGWGVRAERIAAGNKLLGRKS